MIPRHNGFTLLEVCLALMIGLLLITLAVPSILGVLGEQRLKHSFETFDRFVQDAKMKSIHEHRDYVMKWNDKEIVLTRVEADEAVKKSAATDDAQKDRFVFEKKESYSLERTAALATHPAREWAFWKGGICEPAQIAFQGSAGKWTVRYDPLTIHGVFLESEVK